MLEGARRAGTVGRCPGQPSNETGGSRHHHRPAGYSRRVHLVAAATVVGQGLLACAARRQSWPRNSVWSQGKGRRHRQRRWRTGRGGRARVGVPSHSRKRPMRLRCWADEGMAAKARADCSPMTWRGVMRRRAHMNLRLNKSSFDDEPTENFGNVQQTKTSDRRAAIPSLQSRPFWRLAQS